jgi:hypothetical protein
MTKVRFSFDEERVQFFSSRPIFEPVLLPSIRRLTDLLEADVKQEIEKLFEKILKPMIPTLLKSGKGKELVLNLGDKNGPMFVPAVDSIANKYPVVRPSCFVRTRPSLARPKAAYHPRNSCSHLRTDAFQYPGRFAQ